MAVDTLPEGYVINNQQQSSNGLPDGYVINPKQTTPMDVLRGVNNFANASVDFSNTGITKSLTGKSLQDRALDATTPNIPQVGSAPYDANIPAAQKGLVGDIAKDTLAGSAGTVADTLTSPASLAFAAAKPIAATGKAIGEGAANLGRYFSRVKSTFSPKAIENLNVPATTRLSNLAGESQAIANKDIQPLQQNIINIKKSQFASNLAIQESKNVLKQNLDKLKGNLQDVAEKGAVDFQHKLPDFFQANSEAYGSARDAGIAKMAANGDGITYKQVSDAISKTKQDIQNALIPSDAPALNAIAQLEKKYAPQAIGNQSGILDSAGNPIVKTLPNNGNDFVDPNQLIQDLRNVKSTLSAGAKNGRTGFNQEDLAVGYLDHNLGDFIKAKVPGFAQLQANYTPVIKAMKQAHIIFKPNQGEFNTVTATNFLKKAGSGSLEEGQEKLLGALEKGSSFSPGVGEISQEVKQVGSKIDQVKTAIRNLDVQKQSVRGATQKQIDDNIANIAKRKELLQKRMDSLEATKQKIIRLNANKNVAAKIKGALFGNITDAIPGSDIIKKLR